MVSAKASDAQQWQAVQRGVLEGLRGELAQGGGEGAARLETRLQVGGDGWWWMHGWMHGWMGGWVDGCMGGWVDG